LSAERKKRAVINPVKTLNLLRKERNLPPATESNPLKITKKVIHQVAVEVWRKYPQSLTDPNYTLGEMTLDLVNQEITQKIDDLRRGVVVKQAALKDYFN